jgi:hypothetical protein
MGNNEGKLQEENEGKIVENEEK